MNDVGALFILIMYGLGALIFYQYAASIVQAGVTSGISAALDNRFVRDSLAQILRESRRPATTDQLAEQEAGEIKEA